MNLFHWPEEGCTQNNVPLEINPLSPLSEAYLGPTACSELMNMCHVGAVYN